MARQSEQTGGANSLKFRLGNADFEVSRQVWAVEKLKLDRANPRLGYLLRQHRKPPTVDDRQLHKLLWDIDQVKALYQSVYQNGGLLEDPIVRVDGTVLEGNCRTVVLRELKKKHPEDDRFTRTFVRVLPSNVTDEQTSLLLGELHIAGKVAWRAFDQAKYVWQMNKVYGKTYDFLSTHLRWSRSKLAQKIGAYEETKAYLERTGDPQGINRFSHFEEFMAKKELRDCRDSDPEFMNEFGRWVSLGKLPDSKDVRDLPAVLQNAEAKSVFEKDGIRAARAVLQNPSTAPDRYTVIDQAAAQLEAIPLSDLTAIKNGEGPLADKLRRLTTSLCRVEEFTGIKLFRP